MSFSINDVKMVEEFFDPIDVNSRLKKGWILLSVGFYTEYDDDNTSTKTYILGNTDENANDHTPSPRLQKLHDR